jgi:hypothetical protein
MKWALVFIGGQKVLSFSLPFLCNFLYPHKVGLVYQRTLLEEFLWNLNYIVTFPSSVYDATVLKKSIANSITTLRIPFHPIIILLDFIYAGIIGILAGKICKEIKSRLRE